MNLTQQLSEDVFVLVVRVDIQHLRKCTVDKLIIPLAWSEP